MVLRIRFSRILFFEVKNSFKNLENAALHVGDIRNGTLSLRRRECLKVKVKEDPKFFVEPKNQIFKNLIF